MKVRFGTEADIPLIMELSREYNSLDGLRENFRLDEEYFEAFLNKSLKNGYYVIIPESDDGFLLFTENNYACNPEPYLMDIAFYVRESGRGGTTENMIEAYEIYAKERGIKYVMLSMSSHINHKRLERYYRIKGYKPDSISLIKEV